MMSNEITARLMTRSCLTDAWICLPYEMPVTLPDDRLLLATVVQAQWDWGFDRERFISNDGESVLVPRLLPLVKVTGHFIRKDGEPYRRCATRLVDITAVPRDDAARARLESLRRAIESCGPSGEIHLAADPGVMVRASLEDDDFLPIEFKALDFLSRRAVARLKQDGLKIDAARQAVLDALQCSEALLETLYREAARLARIPESFAD